MKLKLTTLALILWLVSFARADSPLQPNDFVGVIGDSITEQKLYSAYIEDYLLMCQPQPHLKVMQFGWSGETAPGFFARMDNDVLRFMPSIVTTCYGMNDGGYGPTNQEKQDRYREYMDKIVQDFLMNNTRVIVGSPSCVDTGTYRGGGKPAEIYNQNLAVERDIAKDIASQRHCPFADVYDVMHDTMEKAKAQLGEKYQVAGPDGVHPGPNGHLIMAYAFLKALGATGNIGTITLDLAAKSATGTDGHQIESFDGTTVQIVSSKYPFCFPSDQHPDDAKSPNSTRTIIQFFPFNDDLNRFMLVVKDAKGPMKVTWGDQSKQFTADQLTKGINLAAEFLDNPFVAPFEKVHRAVTAQQFFETPMVKGIIHDVPTFENSIPDHIGTVQTMVDSMMKVDQTMFNTAVNLVQPVTHTIKIEPAE